MAARPRGHLHQDGRHAAQGRSVVVEIDVHVVAQAVECERLGGFARQRPRPQLRELRHVVTRLTEEQRQRAVAG